MWPQENLLPGFRDVIEEYMMRMGNVAAKFTSLVGEAIGLPPDAFDQFFELKGSRWQQQHKLKIIKYPDVADLPAGATTQGVGPHKGSPHNAPSHCRLHAIELSASSNGSQRITGSKLQWTMDRLSSNARYPCSCNRTRYGINNARDMYFNYSSSD